MENKYTPVKFGMEWEANIKETDFQEFRKKVIPADKLYHIEGVEYAYISPANNPTGWGSSEENSLIHELQSPPIDLVNLKEAVKLFQQLLEHGAANLQHGEYTEYSGSLHTHISFENNNYPKYWDDVKTFFLQFKEKKFFNKVETIPHRTEGKVGRGEDRASLLYNDGAALRKTKKRGVAINELKAELTTLEIRYNESPTPFWLWFLPLYLNGYKGGSSRYLIFKTQLFWQKLGMKWEDATLLRNILDKYILWGNSEKFHKFILDLEV